MEKEFHFQVRRATAYCKEHGGEQDLSFTLRLTQAKFEDYKYLKDRVKEKLASLGIHEGEKPYWYENPPVAKELIENLRAAIGSPREAQFIPYYAHSYHHRTYKETVVDGVTYRWMGFQNGHFIKFAPALV